MPSDIGIAIGSVCAVAVTALIKAPWKSNGAVSKEMCEEKHRHIETDISEIKLDIRAIREKLEGERKG